MSNKAKLLASAQKYLQKGQLSKAIRDYQKIVEIDPRDIRNRQKLAELLSRAKLTEEALQEYEAVAKYYAENGFYLKAIAVYKQMQRLDPAQVRIYHRLAELNEKQGLIGNALTEYKNLVAYYEQHQMVSEAINVLQKMKDLEPENLNVLVRIAEAYARTGMKEKSREEFVEVVGRLREKGEYTKILKLCELLLPFFPDDPEALAVRAEALIRTGDHAAAVGILQRVTAASPRPSHFELLAEGYRLARDFEREGEVWTRVLELDPEALEPRLALVRAWIDGGRHEAALGELEEWKDSFVQAGMTARIQECYERLHEVFPDDGRIVRTLRAIYEMTGEGDKLFALMADSDQAGDGETFAADLEILEDEPVDEALADLEEIVTGELGEDGGPDAGAGADDSGEPRDDTAPVEPRGGEEAERPVPAAEAAAEEVAEAELVGEADEVPLEFLEEVIDEEIGDAAAADEPAAPAVADTSPGDGGPLELEIEFDLEDLEFDDEPAAGAGVAESAGPQDVPSAPEPVSEEEPAPAAEPEGAFDAAARLEEAVFYLQQNLFDEAEQLCRDVLAADPGNAVARARLDDIAAARRAMDETGAAPDERFDWDGALREILGDTAAPLDAEDAESHYNLGIAYKEMGLLDDAIREFETAMGHPARRLPSLALKALCLVEKADYPAAEQTLRFGLACPDLSREERLNLLFEMGQLKERTGEEREALDWFLQVADEDHFYRDVGIRIRNLRQNLGLPDDGLAGGSGPAGGQGKVTYL